MRIYPVQVEENVRDQLLVRDWVRSGLLDAAQGAAADADLQISPRRTNAALRAVLAFFTMVIIFAAAGLTNVLFRPLSDNGWMLAWIWATICAGGAWALARHARLYRCGGEEMLAVLAVGFLAGGMGALPGLDNRLLAGLIAGAIGSLGVYLTFGYRYTLVAATFLSGLTPVALRMDEVTVGHRASRTRHA